MSRSLYASKKWAFCFFCLFWLYSFQAVFAAPHKAEDHHKSHHVAHPARSSTPKNPFKTPFDTDSSDEDITPADDGPTSDRSPGLGIEFEASSLELECKVCKAADTFSSKGKEISGHTNKYWSLTVDTTTNSAGRVKGEYILNGKEIKLGAGTAVTAAENVEKDLVKWNQYATMPGNSFSLLDPVNNECKTWKVTEPPRRDAYKQLRWQVQATAPMPLSGINALMERAKTSLVLNDPLLPSTKSFLEPLVWVNSEFFQNSPQGNTPTGVNKDTLGFFSLILSYVKPNMHISDAKIAFKPRSPIMPRTDFVTMYNDVKSNIKGTDLYGLVLTLLCFQNYEEYIDLKEPKLRSEAIPKLTFEIEGDSRLSGFPAKTSFTVQEWMEGLQGTGAMTKKVNQALNKADPKSKRKDTDPVNLVAVFDRWYDGQIGAYGSAVEHVYGNDKQLAPLFEFRNLGGLKYDEFKTRVSKIEQRVIYYHKNHGS
ncbi:hypothetical protein BO94DRAFT_591620 [Aspergillus sclerotioniger CBS 115572]|uniref:Uncharacterized protein n=1 Tax=Aspergillus sclerotioniger CBS 115572 TaxID=1450535 RepID=A0A317XD86_9EURO|nr:hypothetical protein BO94DRAFT_591620 [Aspergillus sclerotioniger CBS 115572]PWY96121.1 hypothetical protein BO94DRAFT_591620 [Aspergillus sclerotioniger CBS 115572]